MIIFSRNMVNMTANITNIIPILINTYLFSDNYRENNVRKEYEG